MKKVSSLLSDMLILLGCALTLTELILYLQGSSLCNSTGCRVVESYMRVNPAYMYVLGFLLFCFLFVAEHRKDLKQYGPTLVTFALAAEGYLVGFQLFIVNTVCLFCATVASLILGIGILKLFGDTPKQIVTGFCLFAIMCSLVGLVNVSSSPIPSGKQNVLIYSKNCPHCEDVIRFSKERGITLTLCEANKVKDGLRWMGIDVVPVLICNDAEDKKIYTGAKHIESVLMSTYESHANEIEKARESSRNGMRNEMRQTNNKNDIISDRQSSASFMDFNRLVFQLKESAETCSINKSKGNACE